MKITSYGSFELLEDTNIQGKTYSELYLECEGYPLAISLEEIKECIKDLEKVVEYLEDKR